MKTLLAAFVFCFSLLSQEVSLDAPQGTNQPAYWKLTLPNGALLGPQANQYGWPICYVWHCGSWLLADNTSQFPNLALNQVAGLYVYEQTNYTYSDKFWIAKVACDNECTVLVDNIEVGSIVPDNNNLVTPFANIHYIGMCLKTGYHNIKVKVKNYGPDPNPTGLLMYFVTSANGCYGD